MRVAQRLYENGFITYMRTDSTTLSGTALAAARAQARELYGDAYVPAEPRTYTRRVKNAQEAHEAIVPRETRSRTPGRLAGHLSSEEFRLYELIWQRTLASQMADAVGTTVVRPVGRDVRDRRRVEFATSGRTITFPGFLGPMWKRRRMAEKDDAGSESRTWSAAKRSPRASSRRPRVITTSPPARYTEVRSSRRSRSSASAALRPTCPSCRRFRIVGTSGRRAPRSCAVLDGIRGGSDFWSRIWWLRDYGLRPASRTTWTRSPTARPRGSTWLRRVY